MGSGYITCVGRLPLRRLAMVRRESCPSEARTYPVQDRRSCPAPLPHLRSPHCPSPSRRPHLPQLCKPPTPPHPAAAGAAGYGGDCRARRSSSASRSSSAACAPQALPRQARAGRCCCHGALDATGRSCPEDRRLRACRDTDRRLASDDLFARRLRAVPSSERTRAGCRRSLVCTPCSEARTRHVRISVCRARPGWTVDVATRMRRLIWSGLVAGNSANRSVSPGPRPYTSKQHVPTSRPRHVT
jgi:hypothetical protein